MEIGPQYCWNLKRDKLIGYLLACRFSNQKGLTGFRVLRILLK